MLVIDDGVVRYLNSFSSRSCVFDEALRFLQGAPLFKGVVLLMLAWWALFSASTRTRRDQLVSVLLLSVPGGAIGRVLAAVLPFRPRPVHDPTFGFHPACGFEAPKLSEWSSFPSDHAVLYYMLATGVWFASRRLGWLAYAYITVLVMFPRVYLGLHWPTDILAGAALGIALAYVARLPAIADRLGRWSEALRQKAPGPFYAALFVWSYLLATNFDELRHLGSRTLEALHVLRAS